MTDYPPTTPSRTRVVIFMGGTALLLVLVFKYIVIPHGW